jgi:hypothetical protein
MKKFIIILIMIIGHLLLATSNFYFTKAMGFSIFQSFLFFILAMAWQYFCIKEIKNRIYGSK